MTRLARRLARILLLLGSVTFLSSAARSDPRLSAEIVVLGDSLTAGYGLSPAQAYPALLQQRIDAAGLAWKVINAGISGDTTAGGLRRVDSLVSNRTGILIVALGANDGLRRFPPEAIRKNLETIIARARQKSPQLAVLLAGMRLPEELVGPDYRTRYIEAFAMAAENSDAVLLPYLLDQVGGIPLLNQSDRLHPTAEGQKIMAATVWKVLKPLLDTRRRNSD